MSPRRPHRPRPVAPRALLALLALLALVAPAGVTACTRDSRAAEPRGRAPGQPVARPATPQPAAPTAAVRADTSGRFVVHPEHIPLGRAAPPQALALRNPYEGDRAAIATGAKLFVAYNCVDCHGADGSGAMGPSLADGRWHFGGSAGEVYESIYQGRPDGMPAWGNLIAPDQIWRLVAYVRSLQAGKDVTTEDFRTRAIERTGH